MSQPQFGIRVVAQKTGLSACVIRIWEKRYQAVKPSRTPTKRRLYTPEDLERLRLLQQATHAGHSIGAIALLPNEALARLCGEVSQISSLRHSPDPGLEFVLEECLAAIRALNPEKLEHVLVHASAVLGQHGLLQQLVAPLATRIGELWRDGIITAAHEHFASVVLRSFLLRNSRPFAPSGEMPAIVIATPSGQLHELGAVMAAAAASDVGWRVVYLGPSLPAADIAAAAIQNDARLVALSLVYPEDDPNLPSELENLKALLPVETRIIAGGRAAAYYEDALRKAGVIRITSITELYGQLDDMRRLRATR